VNLDWSRQPVNGTMAKPPEKPAKPPGIRVLPMQLQVGDRLTDETGDWEVIGRPYTTAGGRDARVRVQRMGEPGGIEIRIWRAHERVRVKRATAEEGKRFGRKRAHENLTRARRGPTVFV
jgi:hypothetical protein